MSSIHVPPFSMYCYTYEYTFPDGDWIWALEEPVLACVEVYDYKINLLRSTYNRYKESPVDFIDVNEYTSFKKKHQA